MNTSDSALLERWITRRDPEAMAAIVSRYSSMVYATCRRVTGNASDAEDLAQECFLRLSSVTRAGTSLAGLLHTMATRLSLNKARGDARRRARETEYSALAGDVREPAWDDIQPLIDEAIAALPEERRVVIVRHFLRGETHAEIADDLGLTRAAVSKRIARGVGEAREALRRKGVTVSATALGTMLATACAEAAPAGLIAALGRIAVSGAGRTAARAVPWGTAWGKVAMLATILAAGIGGFFAWRANEHVPVPGAEERAAAVPANNDPVTESVVAGGVANEEPSTTDVMLAKVEIPRGEGELRAYVTDRTGLPAAGILVTLSREGSSGALPEVIVEGTTDMRGKLVLEELAWGRYFARAAHGESVARAAVTLDMERPLAQAELVLKPGGDITGRLADAEDAPVAGAAIQLMDEEGDDQAHASAVTDEDGAFVLEDIPLGRYRVRAIAEGFAPALTEEVCIDSAPLAITMLRGGALDGIVRLSSTQLPAPGVALTLGSPEFGGLERTITTDERGRFRVDTLPPGPCHIVCADGRYAFNPVRAEFAVVNERVERAELFLLDGAQVSGTITDGATGAPLAGALVYASDLPSRMHSWKSAPTGPDGRYIIRGLSSGDCEISAHGYPPRYAALDGNTETVQLEAGEVRDGVDFEYYQGTLVEGVVLDEEGFPLPRARVVLDLIRPGDEPRKGAIDAFTDASGAFFFTNVGLMGSRDEDGDGESDLHLQGAKVALCATYRDTRSEVMEPLDLPPGGISGITLRLKPTPTSAISGFMKNELGEPAHARVMFDRLDIPHLGSRGATGDLDGFYLANNLEAGTYGLRIVPRDDHERIIALSEGQRITDLEIVIVEGLRITGRVVDAEGRPVRSANVSVSRPIDPQIESVSLETDSASTDADGRFEIENLEAGDYEISAGMPGAYWHGVARAGDVVDIVLPPTVQGTDTEP